MEKRAVFSFLLIIFCFFLSKANSIQFDAESDIRYKNTDFKQNKLGVERVGLGIKEIISDDKGDRVLIFCRAEFENNFSEFLIGQLYSQYKGPMGKWNIIAGRFLLPFGIMTNYDSEWLLVETLKNQTLSLKYDSGLKVTGIINNFEYALSVTQGIGPDHWLDDDINKLVTFRAGKAGDDFEELSIGISGAVGSVYVDNTSLYKKIAAVDFTQYYDLFIFRGEVTAGKENNNTITGVFLGIDYRIFPSIDINLWINYFKNDILVKTGAVGISYDTNFFGLKIRAAHKFPLGEGENETSIQFYNSYSFVF